MIITDKKELLRFNPENRLWQGIPSIEVTKNGRIFVTFYSGSPGERIGNFAMVVKSDDDGKTFTNPIVAAYKEEHRCFDPCLWIDPLGRLWFVWAIMPNDGVYASICEDPDADELVWSEAFFIGCNIMMNKPTVLSTGEWLFPIAIWKNDMRNIYRIPYKERDDVGAYAYKTVDNGVTFERMGAADVPGRDFDEHVIVEMNDERLALFARTDKDIGVSYSYDRGKTWSPGEATGYGGPTSRFQIRRLKSGRLLMVNHVDTKERTNLAALLSEDDGKTWKYRLMLDTRPWVSYPDATQTEDGTIYITYDRERGGSSLETTYKKAREILVSKITEEDIIAGELVNKKSYMKRIVSKLGKYAYEEENPYGEARWRSDEDLAKFLIDEHPDCIVEKLFDIYAINCVNIKILEGEKLDALIDELNKKKREESLETVVGIVRLIRSAVDDEVQDQPLVNAVKDIILSSGEVELSVSEIAKKLGVSLYYMVHQFKKITGTTITEYRTEIKITKAKKLLVTSDISVTEIAQKCGFGSSSYFSKVFMRSEKLSPSDYRKNLKKI